MWRDIDPRDDERERPDLSRATAARSDGGASKCAESVDALTCNLDLPRGSTRRPVRDRDRWIALRESEVRMLATAGAFRVVVASDLRDMRGRPASASNGELRALREAGLVEQVVAPLKRHRNPQTRAHAEARAKELAGLTVRLHAALMQTALGVRLP